MSARTGTLVWLPALLDHEALDATEVLLMVSLAEHVGADDTCYVGIRTLAKAARVSYPTARRRLQALEQRGYIERTQRHRADGGQSVYTYRLRRSALDLPPINLEGGPCSPSRAEPPARQGDHAEPPRDEPPRGEEPTQALFDDPQPGPQPVDDGFDRFWSAFPCKRGKPAAARAWATAVKRAPAETIIAAAERYRDDPNRSESFTKWPQGWLNDQRWNDPPLPSRTGAPTSAIRGPMQSRELPERLVL